MNIKEVFFLSRLRVFETSKNFPSFSFIERYSIKESEKFCRTFSIAEMSDSLPLYFLSNFLRIIGSLPKWIKFSFSQPTTKWTLLKLSLKNRKKFERNCLREKSLSVSIDEKLTEYSLLMITSREDIESISWNSFSLSIGSHLPYIINTILVFLLT